jgi:cytochrome b561
MKTLKRTIATLELILVFPAWLFMTALFLRDVQPAAQTGRLVDWFAALPVQLGLYLLLVALPFAAFIIGCATLLRGWRSDSEFRKAVLEIFATARAHLAALLVAGATLTAGVILVLVAMHMITE